MIIFSIAIIFMTITSGCVLFDTGRRIQDLDVNFMEASRKSAYASLKLTDDYLPYYDVELFETKIKSAMQEITAGLLLSDYKLTMSYYCTSTYSLSLYDGISIKLSATVNIFHYEKQYNHEIKQKGDL